MPARLFLVHGSDVLRNCIKPVTSKRLFCFHDFHGLQNSKKIIFLSWFYAQQYRINPTIFHVEDISCSNFTSILFMKFTVFILNSEQIHLEMIIFRKYSSCRCTIVLSSFDLNNIIDLIVSFLNSFSIIYLMPLLPILNINHLNA